MSDESRILWDLGFQTIKDLETPKGILASGRNEIYGCIFGRDSLITSLKLLRVYEKTNDPYFLSIVKKVLLNLFLLQGKEVNIQSGEEPGKCIHEFRPDKHEHLTKRLDSPWYVYGDGTMRNYDTVDATPLFLIAIYEYYSLTKDEEFLQTVLPGVHSALLWLEKYGDSNKDGFIDYYTHPERTYGGLVTQSWMDSADSVFHEDGEKVTYPIAPVEVQAYAYVALRSWADFFQSKELELKAGALKIAFNKKFITEDIALAFAIDGAGKACVSARSSMGHALWSVYRGGNELESILEKDFIPHLINRLMQRDLFEPNAGIRTLSNKSRCFEPNSYHNGSIWPHDTSIIVEGMLNFGFSHEASQVRGALLKAYIHFNTPIELFVFSDTLAEYSSLTGQKACKNQAWSAAALLSEVLA